MTIGRIPSVEGGIQPTIVDAKGDILTATAADTPAVLTVGSNGDTLVADSSATTGLRWQGNFAAGKNKIINGDFGIWQRGTSFTSVNGNYSSDRWISSTDKTVTVSRQGFTAGTAPVAGYEGTYFIRMAQSASGNYYALQQKVEDVRTFAGQTVTLSFWAKSNNTVANRAGIGQNFGSGGSATVDNYSSSFNITTSWARYSYTVTLGSMSGKTIGTNSFLAVQPILTENSTAHDIDLWGVQLEIGSTATAFQTATGTLAGELAACQRYYEKSYALATAIGTASVSQAFNGFYTVGSNQKMVNPGLWKVQKRTSPTVTVYDDAGNSGKISTLDTGGTATNNVAIAIIDTDDSSFRALGSSNGTQAGYKWNWVASAEL